MLNIYKGDKMAEKIKQYYSKEELQKKLLLAQNFYWLYTDELVCLSWQEINTIYQLY